MVQPRNKRLLTEEHTVNGESLLYKNFFARTRPTIMTAPDGQSYFLSIDENGWVTGIPTYFPGPPAPVRRVAFERVMPI